MRSKAKILLFLLLITILSGCARGRVFVLGVGYTKEAEPPRPPEGARVVSLALSQLEDARQIKDKIGIRRAYGERPDYFQLSGVILEDILTKGVESQLRRAGMEPIMVPRWDLRPETLPDLPQDYLLGGKLTSLWTDVDTSVGGNKVKVKVELELALASIRDKRVVWRNVITSTKEFRDPFYMTGRVQGALNDALSNAINRILYNTDLQRLLWGKPVSG